MQKYIFICLFRVFSINRNSPEEGQCKFLFVFRSQIIFGPVQIAVWMVSNMANANSITTLLLYKARQDLKNVCLAPMTHFGSILSLQENTKLYKCQAGFATYWSVDIMPGNSVLKPFKSWSCLYRTNACHCLTLACFVPFSVALSFPSLLFFLSVIAFSKVSVYLPCQLKKRYPPVPLKSF